VEPVDRRPHAAPPERSVRGRKRWHGRRDGSSPDYANGAGVGLIGRNGVLKRLPTGAAADLSVTVDDITADGHTIFGVRHTTVSTSGPITEVGVVWHC
jgi:hypothetical protein